MLNTLLLLATFCIGINAQIGEIQLLSTLLSQHLSGCSAIIFANQRSPDLNKISKILSLLSARQTDAVFHTMIKNTILPQIARIDFNTIQAVPKYRTTCMMIISYFDNPNLLELEAMQQFFNVATLATEHNYFIFPTKPHWTKKLLLSSLGTKIVHKLVFEQINEHLVIAKTTCIHCNDGFPKILVINLINKTKTFPDFLQNFQGASLRTTVASK